ncbi:hypothetical protein E2562_017733 [Oryza meyeriana var. granulata]|uniref:Uncharacterized protein n=1 Tax=Oryza meyeriana var. granulata TaxID=110450 RepID=A0A6G1BXT4_9ORYZ|nr:hypothetical protein E2562_017733 [Oryza meyeriana var. granulata]
MAPLCFPGAIYWSAGSLPATQRMLRFDLHDEEFTDFPPLPCMELEDPHGYLTELGGKLFYSHAPGDTVQLWVADDGATKPAPWSLLCTIKLWRPSRVIIPFSAYEGGIFINMDFAIICKYDTERQVLELVVDMHEDMDRHPILLCPTAGHVVNVDNDNGTPPFKMVQTMCLLAAFMKCTSSPMTVC